jgi:hypothetical protein
MRTVVVGGSASNVGKTTLACHLLATAAESRKVAMKVSVHEGSDSLGIVLIRRDEMEADRGDSRRLLEAGASVVVWVTTSRSLVRAALAKGLFAARRLRPELLVVESTAAGIHLRRNSESWFVLGDAPGKPWAAKHLQRATHVLLSSAVLRGTFDKTMIA